METAPHRGSWTRCGAVGLARKGDTTVAYRTLNLDPVETGQLAAFSEHMLKCGKCCKHKTISPKALICIRGLMLAAKAGQVLMQHHIGHVSPGHIGTETG